ncbi:alpha-hydroxy acid oxidase [Leisingera sp. ANG-Vp]|uniref:alpha-hydroxy acid oxidase n=1 Tax=Leisingera sp. ANG-Vp TaxID=1577896 RepID=UPI0009E1BBB4|nr:alpha-hydroxy acid oxidase [Leisingera sp. ANG-Vp]
MSPADDLSSKGSRIFSTEDAMRLAKRRQPKLVHDFIEGAAGREVACARNCARFDEITLQPRVMADVAERNLSTSFLEQAFDRPFGIAPMGMCNLAWPNADLAFARAARGFNIPVCLSTAASSSIEEMREWAGDNAWFQLYVGGPVEQALEMVERARKAGYQNLLLTVDVPQVSRRVRDLRNGFQMPFRIGPRQFWDFATHPRWAWASLQAGAPEPKNFKTAGGGSRFDRGASRAGADWGFLDRLRGIWKGKLIIKGVTSAADAQRIKQAGADAIYVSNHGGRQLDSAPAAIDILPRIRSAVGADYPLIFDSGVRNGEDIIKALALGADFVMLGRPFLHAAGAEGARGVNALVRLLTEETSIVLAQTGQNDIGKVSAAMLAHRHTDAWPDPIPALAAAAANDC